MQMQEKGQSMKARNRSEGAEKQSGHGFWTVECERVRALLDDALAIALTRSNLARQLRVSHQAVSTWVLGKCVPDRKHVLALEMWLRQARRKFPHVRR